MQQRKRRFKKRGLAAICGVFGVMILVSAWFGFQPPEEAQQLRELTDAPARMIWVRQAHYGSKDVFARGERFQLMGLDTEGRRGVHVILHGIENYNKPMFVPDGDRIVFSDLPADKIYVVNWDGTGLQQLHTGRAVEVWRDPQTGQDWVYRIPSSRSTGDESATRPLTRFLLDNPPKEELVWDQTRVNANSIQLSQDGAYMCGLFPWPEAGLLDVQAGEFIRLGRGCWPSMAPDNSYMMWIFDGPHRNLLFHSRDNRRQWSVHIADAPGIDGYEVYHPRWSNHDRFMVMTGPYHQGIYGGGEDVSVYAGRFNEYMTDIEAWVRITDHGKADFFPDLWVKPGTGAYRPPDMQHVGESVAETEPSAEGISVEAELLEKTPIPAPADIAPYTQTLVVYRYRVHDVLAGSYDRAQVLVAHWGIVESRLTPPGIDIGERIRLDLEPYAGRDELEGERLVMELSNMNLPLYYDVRDR